MKRHEPIVCHDERDKGTADPLAGPGKALLKTSSGSAGRVVRRLSAAFRLGIEVAFRP